MTDPLYVPSPYPSTRYHESKGSVTVSDVDEEIAKCGEACDTVGHKSNKHGWRDRPHSTPTRPVKAMMSATPNNLADLTILAEKLQRAVTQLTAQVTDVSNQLASVRDRLSFVEEMAVAASSPSTEPIPVTAQPGANKKR